MSRELWVPKNWKLELWCMDLFKSMKIWYQFKMLWSPYWRKYGLLQAKILNLVCRRLNAYFKMAWPKYWTTIGYNWISMFFFECFYFIYKLQVNVQLWSSRQRSLVNGVKLKCQYLVHCRNLFPTNYYCTHMQIMKLLALYHYHFTMETN